MRTVRLASETDFAGWRAAARALRTEGVAPEEVTWTTEADLFAPAGGEAPVLRQAQDEGFADASHPPHPELVEGRGGRTKNERPFTVPPAFLDLAEMAALNRDPHRWTLLYRLLWRLQGEPRLIEIVSDPDVAAARDLAKAVSRASHKMKAFVRFRLVEVVEPETYVAWFEPAHFVAEKTAPFFVRRFHTMRFSILTPDACAHWDTQALTFTPGVDRSLAPSEDAHEEFWRTYYASIFNPARLKVDAMTKEMPKRYWRNLPEAALIPSLIANAETRTTAMIDHGPSTPRKKTAAGAAARVLRERMEGVVEPGDTPLPASVKEIAELIQGCRRCDLWACATQAVPGEGPAHAPMMLVGEQPGDMEDLKGKPFVGPAGQMLDRALADAGVPREDAYVTNAVKHFKHEPRGKRRMHKTPDTGEVTACRWWLDNERRLIKPRAVVALGATAVMSVFGKAMPIGKSRQQRFQLEDQSQGFITWHPSFLLRVPDEAAKKKAYAELVADLAFAHEWLKQAA